MMLKTSRNGTSLAAVSGVVSLDGRRVPPGDRPQLVTISLP